MFRKLQKFYLATTQPISPQLDDARLEKLTRIILFFATLVTVTAAVGMVTIQTLTHSVLLNMLYGTVCASVILFLAWVFTVFGWWWVTRYTLVILGFLVVIYLELIYPIGAIASLYSIATILFSIILLERKKAWLILSLILLTPIIIGGLIFYGFYSRPPYEMTYSWYTAIALEFAMVIIGITILLDVFSIQLKDALKKAEDYAIELEAHKQSLETTVAERTAELQNSLAEKEVLLREIHHRVKNNLQIVAGLLYLQSKQSDSPDVRTPLEESHKRVKSMAMVHEMLYQAPNLGQIDFSDYARKLTNFIAQTYRNPHISINFEMEPTILPIDTAITTGLILNELVTNVYKYAFQNGDSGLLTVSLNNDRANKHHLIIADTGRGFSIPQKEAIKNDGLDNFNHQKSLGLHLVTQLTRQLQGEITLSHDNGSTTFEIVF